MFREQSRGLASFGLGGTTTFPGIDQVVAVCTSFREWEGERLLFRSSPVGPTDSGWFVGCSDSDHDHKDRGNVRGATVYEVMCARPELVAYLALPSELSLIVTEDGRLKYAERDGVEVRPDQGSYLASLESKP
jgi:hypothetical protein